MRKASYSLFAFLFAVASSTAQTGNPTDRERSPSAREGTSVFGLRLGLDTLAEVQARVKLQNGSLCERYSSIMKECRSTYEVKSLGGLRVANKYVAIDDYGGVNPADAKVLFAKFSSEGEYLVGTFFEDILIALSVTGEYSGDNLDFDVDAKALMSSFDKKYRKKVPSIVKTSTEDGVTDKYTFHVWNSPTGAFEVHVTRHDSILVNRSACLRYLRTLLDISADSYNKSKHVCEGSFTQYQLEYRSPTLYMQALDNAHQLEFAKRALKENAATQKVNKY